MKRLYYYRITVETPASLRLGALCIAHKRNMPAHDVVTAVLYWHNELHCADGKSAQPRYCGGYNLCLEEYLVTNHGYERVTEGSADATNVYVTERDIITISPCEKVAKTQPCPSFV